MGMLLLGTANGIVTLDPAAPVVQTRGGPDGRVVTSVAVTDGVRFAAVRRDGIYRDEGGTWVRVWEGDVHTLLADPRRPGRLYAGVEPAMVLRSDDAGRTWRRCEAIDRLPTRASWSFPAPPHEPHVRTLVAHPSEPDTLYAGVEVGGVLRTRDGGETWEELNEGIYIDVHTLAVSRAAPERMYACTGTGFYRSTNGGQSWVRSMEGLARRYTVGLTVMPGDTDIVVAAAGTGPPGVNGEVFVSRDSGATWQPAGDGLPERMTRVPALAAAECRLYAGLDTGALYRSEDAGRTWQRLADVGAPILTMTPVLA